MDSNNKLELRSEKVRNFIGKMPSKIIRIGSGSIVIAFFLLIFGSNFFYINNQLKVKAKISKIEGNWCLQLYIPSEKIKTIHKNQTVRINLGTTQYTSETLLDVKINSIPKNQTLCMDGIFYISKIVLSKDILGKNNITICINGTKEVSAEIIYDRISVFNKVKNVLLGRSS